MRASHVSYSLLGGFIGAIATLRLWERTTYPWWVWATCLLCAVVALQQRRWLILAGVIGVTLSFWRISETTISQKKIPANWLIEGNAMIIQPPEKREKGIRYILAIENVPGYAIADDRSTNIRFHLYDQVRVRGQLSVPEPFDGVAYERILALRGIQFVVKNPKLSLQEERNGLTMFGSLAGIRENIEARIRALFPEPQASLLIGLLTGSRGTLPKSVSDDFTATGLTHILAISGFNITLILSLVIGSLFFVPKRWRFFPAGAAVMVFTLFVGASASAVRACIMGCLGLLALQSGRLNHLRLSVLWTMAFMLFWKPQSLWDDAGFQLSFLAVISLSECGNWLKPWTDRLPEYGGIREQLHLTLTAQILTAPWIAWIFGRVSLVSPIANVFMAPAVPLAMLFGALTIAADAVHSRILTFLLQPLAGGLLSWMLLVPRFFAQIPFANVAVPRWIGILSLVGIGLCALTRRTDESSDARRE